MLHESPEDLTAYHDDDHVVQDQDQEYDVTQNLQDQDMSFFEQDKFSGLEDVGYKRDFDDAAPTVAGTGTSKRQRIEKAADEMLKIGGSEGQQEGADTPSKERARDQQEPSKVPPLVSPAEEKENTRKPEKRPKKAATTPSTPAETPSAEDVRDDDNMSSASDGEDKDGSKMPRPFTCSACKRKFKKRGHLRDHMRTHTGEKPYGCPYPKCGKRFSQKGVLTRHMLIHTGDKPYKCPKSGCDRSFTQKGDLKRHLKSHKDYQPPKNFLGSGNDDVKQERYEAFVRSLDPATSRLLREGLHLVAEQSLHHKLLKTFNGYVPMIPGLTIQGTASASSLTTAPAAATLVPASVSASSASTPVSSVSAMPARNGEQSSAPSETPAQGIHVQVPPAASNPMPVPTLALRTPASQPSVAEPSVAQPSVAQAEESVSHPQYDHNDMQDIDQDTAHLVYSDQCHEFLPEGEPASSQPASLPPLPQVPHVPNPSPLLSAPELQGPDMYYTGDVPLSSSMSPAPDTMVPIPFFPGAGQQFDHFSDPFVGHVVDADGQWHALQRSPQHAGDGYGFGQPQPQYMYRQDPMWRSEPVEEYDPSSDDEFCAAFQTALQNALVQVKQRLALQ